MSYYFPMLRYSRKLYDKWHNTILLTLYRVMDNYASSERARTMVTRTIIWATVIALSLFLYFAFTHWIPASRKFLDFTAKDMNRPTPEEHMPETQQASKIPVEQDIQY